MKKGISLITLIITIVVVIIIATAVVFSISDTGFFNKAYKAVFISDINAILEEYNSYQAFYIAEGNDVSRLNVDSSNIHEVVTSIPNNWSYKDKIAIINGEITYLVNLKDKDDVERAKWACEAGAKANGVEGCEDIKYIEPLYKKQGGIYYNAPDLTGFNPEKTFYVTYTGNEENHSINISNKPPEDWYDYENQKWANIVAINGDLMTYYVWIPRYAYQVNKKNAKVDVRFVDNDNIYIDKDGNKFIYNDTTPIFDEGGNQTNYVISSAFNVNNGTEESKDIIRLSGFWMMKYELQDAGYISEVTTSVGTDYIEIKGMETNGAVFDYYLDNKLIAVNAGNKYKYEGLECNRIYNIKIIAKSNNGDEIGVYTKEIITLGEETNGITNFAMESYPDKIVIFSTTLNNLAKQNSIKEYEYYLNGNYIYSNSTGIYTFEELLPESIYNVTIKIKDSGGYYGEYTRTILTPGMPIYNEPNVPELGSLAKEGTYYLTWDENGNEIRTEVVDTTGNIVAPPSNWYNYSNKEWANIIVENIEIEAETYMVWIPRYEYRVIGEESTTQSDKMIDISFIPETKFEATPGYILHTSFDINVGTEENPEIKHLSGFWMHKYEIQDVPEKTQ